MTARDAEKAAHWHGIAGEERVMTPAEVLEEARERFALDAPFHAQVKRVVGIVAEDCRQMTGERLTRDEEGAATVAAAATLVLFGALDANDNPGAPGGAR